MSVFIGYPSFMAYQMMKGKKGNNDGFPSIPGMIARYSALGLTNEQMDANPVWVDKTGNGHDIQLKNFSWNGMSGVGGYNQNFNIWGYGNLTGAGATQIHTSSKMNLNIPSTVKNTNIYSNATNVGKEGDIYDFTLKVMGLKDGALLRITKGVSSGDIERIEKDGIYKIYQPFEAGWDQPRIYIFISNSTSSDLNITIEQLPLYPGALVFDGVDDYGVCDNFPILTKEKGYTVVALRQWIEEKNSVTALASNSKNWNQDGAFVFEYNNLENNYPNIEISFGSNNMFDRGLSPYSYQTSKSYNGNLIESGSFLGSDKLVVAKANENSSPNSNIAIWELVFLDHDATEEELQKIQDYYKQEYPWLFPDQAWTVTGKTNEDTDRATIANITGNGNNLVLSNLGFIEGSGYNEEGEYAGYLVTDGVDDKIISSNFKFGENYTVVGEWKFLQEASNVSAGFVKNSNYWILYNYKDGINAYIKADAQGSLISGVRSIKASTSKGDIYPDFNSYVKIEPGKRIESQYALNIAVNSSIFTKLAFKNLAIYSEVLSKEDCIKAYNYLQTLKAK